jgi:hypothetical protein
MRRVFWLALGATVGVLVVRRLSKAVDQYSPEGVGRSLSNVAESLREMADAVREGMAEREQVLRAALGADGELDGVRLDPEQARALLANPTGNPRDR